jgi:hypothetical protein
VYAKEFRIAHRAALIKIEDGIFHHALLVQTKNSRRESRASKEAAKQEMARLDWAT